MGQQPGEGHTVSMKITFYTTSKMSHQVSEGHQSHIVAVQWGVHARANSGDRPQECVQGEVVLGEGLPVLGKQLCVQLCKAPLEERPAVNRRRM